MHLPRSHRHNLPCHDKKPGLDSKRPFSCCQPLRLLRITQQPLLHSVYAVSHIKLVVAVVCIIRRAAAPRAVVGALFFSRAQRTCGDHFVDTSTTANCMARCYCCCCCCNRRQTQRSKEPTASLAVSTQVIMQRKKVIAGGD